MTDNLTRLVGLLNRMVSRLEVLTDRLDAMDASWRDAAYGWQRINPDDFKRLLLDVEAIKRSTQGGRG